MTKQMQRKVAEDPGWRKRKARKLRNRSKLKVVTMAGFEDFGEHVGGVAAVGAGDDHGG